MYPKLYAFLYGASVHRVYRTECFDIFFASSKEEQDADLALVIAYFFAWFSVHVGRIHFLKDSTPFFVEGVVFPFELSPSAMVSPPCTVR